MGTNLHVSIVTTEDRSMHNMIVNLIMYDAVLTVSLHMLLIPDCCYE